MRRGGDKPREGEDKNEKVWISEINEYRGSERGWCM